MYSYEDAGIKGDEYSGAQRVEKSTKKGRRLRRTAMKRG
jgi:hypothetical protein